MADISVIIASVNGRAYLEPCLRALVEQETALNVEVIVVDVANVSPIESPRENVRIKWISLEGKPGIPAQRVIGLEQSSGEFVFITEDHCIPAQNWVETGVRVFKQKPDVAAVGGVIENYRADGAADWAAFFCEYGSFMAPRPRGYDAGIPGNNVAYRRSALEQLESPVVEAMRAAFWESVLHPWLLKQGFKLFLEPDMVVYHNKHFRPSEYARGRFHYSRYYAGTLYHSRGLFYRLARAGACALLPLVLTQRIVRSVTKKGRLRNELITALPWIGAFTAIWAFGEAVGSIFGPGESLQHID